MTQDQSKPQFCMYRFTGNEPIEVRWSLTDTSTIEMFEQQCANKK